MSRAKKSTSGTGNDLFSQILSDSAKGGSGDGNFVEAGQETYSIFVGTNQAGKTTLKNGFLYPKKEEKSKATVGLEYAFGRRPSANGAGKDIAHVWEIGGSSARVEMVDVALTPARLPSFALVVVVDLSKPATVVPALQRWFTAVRSRAEAVIVDLQRSDSAAVDACFARGSAGFGPEHADASSADPLPLTTVLVGAHADALFDADKTSRAARESVLAALRFVGHMHGAYVLCTSRKDKQSISLFRMVMNDVAFGVPAKKYHQVAPTRPLFVLPGADSLSEIPYPAGLQASALKTMRWDQRWEAWRAAVAREAGVSEEEAEAAAAEAGGGSVEGGVSWDPADFAEPVVDATVERKAEELETYRREAERRRRLQARERSLLSK